MNKDNFVAIGKIMIDRVAGEEWEIPALHFIVNRNPSGLYEAINIELILVAPGNTLEEAVEGLSELTRYHINVVMDEGRGFDEFIESVDTFTMDEYWREYRKIEFSLGKKGKSLSHEITRKINDAIERRLKEEMEKQKELEKRLEKAMRQVVEMKQQVTDMKQQIADVVANYEKSIASRPIVKGLKVKVSSVEKEKDVA